MRETLFNWLRPYILGARVLDAFAGTGALGIEALSQGAVHATFCETSPKLLASLERTIAAFHLQDNATLIKPRGFYGDGTPPPVPFDIMFLDPPFGQYHALDLLATLNARWLKPEGLVYVEMPRRGRNDATLPIGWEWQRTANAGEVRYGLVRQIS